jgi:peptidoglycan/LPS O-acetylase OafA/YrhL
MTSVLDVGGRTIPPEPGNGAAPVGPNGAPPTGTESGAGTRKRLDHIDAMRPIKQAGVVGTHSLLAFAPVASLGVGASLMLLHVTREAFLFVSACMLTYSYKGLGSGGLSNFYRRRFVAVGIPYLCWTFIYFLVTLPDFSTGVSGSLEHLAYLTGTGYYQLYYLLVIMQFYLVFPLAAALITRANGHHGTVLLVSGLLQATVVSLEHWSMLPAAFEGFWATREITSYQFYLVAGMIVAIHLDDVHRWLSQHVRLVISFTLASAAVAEAWFYLATTDLSHWLGSSSDAFQPIVIPFNVGAIACIYLAGMALVDRRRSRRVRAMVQSGSDNSYGVYLAQMLFIIALTWVGWGRLAHLVSWPVLALVTLVIVFLGCVALTGVLARLPLAKALTGRSRATWPSWMPRRSDAGRVGEPERTEQGASPLQIDSPVPTA